MMMTTSPGAPAVFCLALALAGCSERTVEQGSGETSASETEESGESETGETNDEPEPTGPVPTDETEPEPLSEADLAEIAEVSNELELIVAGVLEYFANSDPQLCPYPFSVTQGGEAGYTPPEFFNCNVGPEGRCIPVLGGGAAGIYDFAMWTDNSVWEKVGWSRPVDVPHSFHYNVMVVNDPDGGACSFTAIALADFTDDAVFSTYSISGTVDENGSVVEPLVVESPFE